MKFYRHYWIYFLISAVFLLPGLVALGYFHLRPGIDFTGGSLLTIAALPAASNSAQLSPPPVLSETLVRESLSDSVYLSSVQQNNRGELILRLPPISDEQRQAILASVSAQLPVEQVSFAAVGAMMGKELISKTLIALLVASILLIIYLRLRFQEISLGVAAFTGVVHDVLIICGIFSILGAWLGVEVDVLFVTALLTTISFSVHDTVVIYDRIRELKKKFPTANLRQLAEAAVTATISRSFNNSLTVVFMLAALLLLGGASLHYFALALLLGVIFGTYSSPFHSVPMILFLADCQAYYQKKRLARKKL